MCVPVHEGAEIFKIIYQYVYSPTTSKILEKMLRFRIIRMKDHLTRHVLLFNSQYGFKTNSNTECNFRSCYEDKCM